MVQLLQLIIFEITGIIIGMLFDIFRILRKSFKTSDWLTTIQDILFWIIAGFIILFSILKFNNGEIRIYIFVAILLGILLYIITISKYIVKYSVIVVKFISKILSYPIKFVFKILKFLIIKPVNELFRKIHVFFKKIQKNVTKKSNKIEEKEGIL